METVPATPREHGGGPDDFDAALVHLLRAHDSFVLQAAETVRLRDEEKTLRQCSCGKPTPFGAEPKDDKPHVPHAPDSRTTSRTCGPSADAPDSRVLLRAPSDASAFAPLTAAGLAGASDHLAFGAPSTLKGTADVPSWLERWPIWDLGPTQNQLRESDLVNGNAMLSAYFPRAGTRSLHDGSSVVAGDAIMSSSGFWRHIVLLPSSPKRIFWDVVCIVLLCYDIVVIPLQVTFLGDDTTPELRHLSMASTVLWTVDMLASVCTGFHVNGVVEMRFSKIIRRYLRGWCIFDISICSLDWAIIGLNSSAGKGGDIAGTIRGTKVMRFARSLRVLRLLRLAKVMHIFGELRSIVRTEQQMIMIRIVRLLMMVVIMNHYIACAWFAIGTAIADSGAERAWVNVAFERESLEGSGGQSYKYTSSLHWSLTQFTPASMEIVPTNVVERLFTICVIVFALVIFSSVVSSITAASTNLQRINQDRLTQDENLRRYITENKVSFRVGSLIYGFFRNSKNKNDHDRLHESDVGTLQRLPNVLKMMLRSDVFAPHLSKLPFFHFLKCTGDGILLNLCDRAVGQESSLAGHELFSSGENCTNSILLVSGTFNYYFQKSSHATEVVPGSHLCEAVLWVHWVHRGRLLTRTQCELLVLRPVVFREVISQAPRVQRCAQEYARLFSERAVQEYQKFCDIATSGPVPGIKDQLSSVMLLSDHQSDADLELIWQIAASSFDGYYTGSERKNIFKNKNVSHTARRFEDNAMGRISTFRP